MLEGHNELEDCWLVGWQNSYTYQIYQNSIHTSRILTMQHGRQIQNTEEILTV